MPAITEPAALYIRKRTREEDRGYETVCWVWTLALYPNGYGRAKRGGKQYVAHRVSYRAFVGEIVFELDHLCRQRDCVRPDHLEDVEHRVNVDRGVAPNAVARRTGLCKRGHDDFVLKKDGKRECRVCRRLYNRQAYWKRREKKAA